MCRDPRRRGAAGRPVANREGDLDSLFGRFPDVLVVVDQSRNIGALALARARAAGMPAAYLPGLAAARALAAQRNFLTCENTRNKNRLRSILLESCPAFEALVDLSDGPQLFEECVKKSTGLM